MKKSKIIALFRKLDSRAIGRFCEYLASPYHNKHKHISRLGQYLAKYAPDFKKESKIRKERVFRHVYPNAAYAPKRFHRLCSNLLQLLHDFLVDDAWQNQSSRRGIELLKVLRQFKLEKHYKSADKKYLRELKKQQLGLRYLHENQYNYHKEKDSLFVELGGRSYDPNLQLTNDYLDQFFILEKLRIACEMANRNQIINADYQWSMTEGIELYLQEKGIENVPIGIQIYYTIYMMLSSEGTAAEEEYFHLKKLLKNHALSLTKLEIADIYNHALNYAIAQINKKGAHYYAEALEHYIFLVEHEAIYVDGYLMPQDYKNIVTIALRLEKYKWTAQFLEDYRSKLRPKDRENVYRYNLASLQYSQKAYKKALQTLYQVDFINPTYYQGAKIIQLKSYYELDEGEALFSLIDAFKRFLSRSKEIATYRKASNDNLLNFVKRMYKLKEKLMYNRLTDKLKSQVHKLATEINNSENVNNLDWLKASLQRLLDMIED